MPVSGAARGLGHGEWHGVVVLGQMVDVFLVNKVAVYQYRGSRVGAVFFGQQRLGFRFAGTGGGSGFAVLSAEVLARELPGFKVQGSRFKGVISGGA